MEPYPPQEERGVPIKSPLCSEITLPVSDSSMREQGRSFLQAPISKESCGPAAAWAPEIARSLLRKAAWQAHRDEKTGGTGFVCLGTGGKTPA